MKRRTFLLSAVALVASNAARAGLQQRISFPKGSTGTSVEGAVIRGERDRYLLKARAGQRIEVRITSIEDNAVMDLLPPDSERALIEEAKDWSGTLPSSGDYTIVVGGTLGNATYKLMVWVQ